MNEELPHIHDSLSRHKEKLPADDESVKRLDLDIDFDKLINLRDKLRNHGDALDEKEVEELLWQMDDEEINRFYSQLFQRIEEETNYLHDWEEMEISKELASGLKKKVIAGSLVDWDSALIKKSMGKPKGGNAFGSFPISIVSIGQKMPTKEEIIESLSRNGELPGSVQVLFHELIHTSTQNPQKLRKFEDVGLLFRRIIKSYYGVLPFTSSPFPRELKEAHAYFTTGLFYKKRNGVVDDSGIVGKAQKIQSARNVRGENLYKNFSTDKLAYGFQTVQRLNALGLSPIEIGRLVQNPGKWDKGSGVYQRMEDYLREQMKKLGLEEEDVDTLVDVEKLEREINKLRVMRIAQEELQKVKIKKDINP